MKTTPPDSNPSRRWPLRLAAKAAAAMAVLLLGTGTASAGLVLELKPGDYDTSTHRWSIADGTMAGDYFQCNWSFPAKGLLGNPGSATGYQMLDFTANGTLLGGPQCPTSLGGDNPKTIEAWCFQPTGVNGDWQTIFDLSRQNGANNSHFAFCNGGYGQAIEARPDNIGWNANNSVRQGKWVYLVASCGGGTVNLYVNGVLDKTLSRVFATESGGRMSIGMMPWCNSNEPAYSTNGADGWNQYRGYLGAIRVYDEARTGVQVEADYNSGAVNYGEAGVAQWKITSSAPGAGFGGTISPLGDIYCAPGATLSFTVTPDQYYDVASVLTSTVGDVLAGPATQTYAMTTVTAADTIDASFTAWELTEITGTVTDGTTGLAGVTVTATGNRGPFPAITGAGGTYSIRVRPGDTYTVTAAKVSYIMDVASLLAGPIDGLTGKNFTATYVQLPPHGMFPDAPFIGAYGTGDTWNLGTKFTTGPDPVQVTELGTWDYNRDGLNNSHPVGIFDASGNSIVTVTVPAGTAAVLIGDWRYVSCGVVTLAPNTTYTLAGNVNGDEWMEADKRGFALPYFSGFTSLGAFATGNASFVCPGPGTGGFQWHAAPDVTYNVNMIGITVAPPPTRTISGSVKTEGGVVIEGASVTLKNGATVVAGPVTSNTDGMYSLDASFADGDTCTVSASKLGFLPGTLAVPIATDVMTYPDSNLTLATDPSYDPDLIFSMMVESLAGLTPGNPTGNRATVYPVGGTMVALNSPKVIDVDGLNWEQNTYSSADGYRFVAPENAPSGQYSAAIPASGVSVVAVVQPNYVVVGGEPRGEIVDLFYSELFLAVNHGNGEVIVNWRGYSQHNTGYFIPNGQKTILCLVVQQTGEMALYANAAQVWTAASGVNYSSLQQSGLGGNAKTITVGRNDYDGWSIFSGNLGDVMLYKTAIDNTKRTELQSSLATKFGITLPVLHTITASPPIDGSGTISPSGDVDVVEGQDKTFRFYGTAGFVDVVTVDDVPEPGHPTSYTFFNVTGPHTISATFTVEPAPANDNFAGAIDLTGAEPGQTGDATAGTQTGTNNIAATVETGEPDIYGANNTVWFKWTAPANGNFTFRTAGSTALAGGEWDSMIGIYTGTSVGALTAVPGSGTPKDNGFAETMTVAVTAGTTYYIQAAGFGNAKAANILLTWSFVGAGGSYADWASTNAPGQTPGEDYNNDGVDNGIAYFMGVTGHATNPGLDGTNTATWPMSATFSGSYEVQTSPDLNTWTNVTPKPTPADGNLKYTLPSGLGTQFVRLLVIPN
ncbi:MAG: carboxypeptidase regulatory-like domain-containing protein [Verrucomicrobia bacterium]|nr:carboxypeptidase regulatory-like domain-containing protein [Verrucomicrobiota bacterium]